ncbi:MAG: hypothetical protein ACOY0T_39320 [Myxococcota bacterium]
MKINLLAGSLIIGVLACTGEDVLLLRVDATGGVGGASGGAASGGSAQGGSPQGGSPQGGSPQGGSAQGGSPQGGSVGMPGVCRSNADCDSGYCEKARCTDEFGRCERRAVACEGIGPPAVCGCDGITYYNDCLRRQAGVSQRSQGECGSDAVLCRGSLDCGNRPGVQCAHLFAPGEPCGPPAPPVPGTCWVIPDVCDPTKDSGRYTECGGPQAGRCADTCNAVRSGHPFVKAASGVCP